MEMEYQNFENDYVIYNDKNRIIELESSPLIEIDYYEQSENVEDGKIVIFDKTQGKYFKILYS